MSFTRFHDDPVRIQKRLEESTFSSNYYLNTPGAGLHLTFQEEPQLRLQHWGANLMTDSTNLESNLRGLGKVLTRDPHAVSKIPLMTSPMTFASSEPFVEDTRASHPAWMYRSSECNRWETPLLNPQANLEKPFQDNIQTRMLEKDYFVPTLHKPMEHVHGYDFVRLTHPQTSFVPYK